MESVSKQRNHRKIRGKWKTLLFQDYWNDSRSAHLSTTKLQLLPERNSFQAFHFDEHCKYICVYYLQVRWKTVIVNRCCGKAVK